MANLWLSYGITCRYASAGVRHVGKTCRRRQRPVLACITLLDLGLAWKITPRHHPHRPHTQRHRPIYGAEARAGQVYPPRTLDVTLHTAF